MEITERRPGGAALRLPRRLRRPRGRRPGAGLGAHRQLAAAFSCELGDDARRGAATGSPASGLTRAPTPSAATCTTVVRRPAAGRVRAGRRQHRPHGGLGALRRPGRRRVRPAGRPGATSVRGWAMAHYLVAQADRLDGPAPSSSTTGSGPPGRAPTRAGATTTRPTGPATGPSSSTATTCTSTCRLTRPGGAGQPVSRATAASTRSSVAVNATRTCWRPAAP